MTVQTLADRWWAAARRRPVLSAFAWINRVLLCLAFLPSGPTKLLGLRFTTLAIDTPVGFFFEAMYRTGIYWRFVGLAQLVAALSLLFPHTQAVGALLYFPIILNIFFITVGMRFQGTPFITGSMLL